MNTLNQAAEKPLIFGQTRLPRRGHSGGGKKIHIDPFLMGRKRMIKIRVNDAEHAALTEMGKAIGGISALIRRHLLKHGDKETRWEAVRELARLARHLSFIARETKHFPPGRAVEILAWLIAIDRQLNEAIQRLGKPLKKC
jgi:hypothetical protein